MKDITSHPADTKLHSQETLNFWKQATHILKYFRAEEDPKAALPKNFIQGFLEVMPIHVWSHRFKRSEY